MQQNRIWFIFLSVLALMTIVLGIQAFIQVMAYQHLSIRVPAQVMNWNVEEKQKGAYTLIADYFFEFEGRTYHGSSPVHAPYKNPWAAEKAQSVFEQSSWNVWINPKHPIHSAIYKSLPIRNILSSIALLAVSIYFLFIKLFFGAKDGYRVR